MQNFAATQLQCSDDAKSSMPTNRADTIGTLPATKNRIRVCRICGDKAIGFNFNVLTCESCKSFFRRNADFFETSKCRKNEDCEIDFVTRKCCTRCRLRKCFSAGMKKELIWKHRAQRKTRSTAKKAACDAKSEQWTSGGGGENCRNGARSPRGKAPGASPNQTLWPENSTTLTNGGNPKIDGAAQWEVNENWHSTQSPCRNNIGDYSSGVAPIIALPAIAPILPQCKLATTYESGPGPRAILVPNQKALGEDRFALSATEIALLDEMVHANSVAAFYESERYEVVGEISDLLDALNLAELYLRKTVKFCKCLVAFRRFEQDEQLKMLKNFFTDLLLVRMCYVFDVEHDAYPVIQNEELHTAVYVSLKLLYEAQKQSELEFCRQHSHIFHREMEQDALIRDLILAQRLFKPCQESQFPELICYQNSVYSRLLQRYLEHKYRDESKAAEKVRRLNEVQKSLIPARALFEEIFLQIDPQNLAHLLNEVFDKK